MATPHSANPRHSATDRYRPKPPRYGPILAHMARPNRPIPTYLVLHGRHGGYAEGVLGKVPPVHGRGGVGQRAREGVGPPRVIQGIRSLQARPTDRGGTQVTDGGELSQLDSRSRGMGVFAVCDWKLTRVC
jgi:hypothetical protein